MSIHLHETRYISLFVQKIRDINKNLKYINYFEETTGNIFQDLGVGKNFLSRPPLAQEPAPEINRWDYIKRKDFCTAKDTINRANRQPTEWERIFISYTSDRG